MGSQTSKFVKKIRKNPRHAYPKAIIRHPLFLYSKKTRKSPHLTGVATCMSKPAESPERADAVWPIGEGETHPIGEGCACV
jgi:hypothetical protein